MSKLLILQILMVLYSVSAFHNSFLPKQSSTKSATTTTTATSHQSVITTSCLFSTLQKEGEEEEEEIDNNTTTTVSVGDQFLNEMSKNLGLFDLMKKPTGPQDTKSKMKRWAGEYDRNATQMKLKDKIENSSIFLVMYGTCPYCVKVLRLLEGKNVNPKTATLVDLDTLGIEKYALRYEVIDMVNQTTVPALWIGSQFIGGYDDLSELNNSGELEKLLEKAGALH